MKANTRISYNTNAAQLGVDALWKFLPGIWREDRIYRVLEAGKTFLRLAPFFAVYSACGAEQGCIFDFLCRFFGALSTMGM